MEKIIPGTDFHVNARIPENADSVQIFRAKLPEIVGRENRGDVVLAEKSLVRKEKIRIEKRIAHNLVRHDFLDYLVVNSLHLVEKGKIDFDALAVPLNRVDVSVEFLRVLQKVVAPKTYPQEFAASEQGKRGRNSFVAEPAGNAAVNLQVEFQIQIFFL